MPELPEVDTIANDLRKTLKGLKIVKVEITNGKKIYPNKNTFIKQVSGATISSVKRIAKNICVELNNGLHLVFHLAMTGRILLKTMPGTEKWEKVRFILKEDRNSTPGEYRRKVKERGKFLIFTDMRTFGKVMVTDESGLMKLKSKYGPDLLSTVVKPEEFLSLLRKKKTNIKNVLMNQTVISGLGNIYATEALFLAGLPPDLNTRDISTKQAKILLNCIVSVLREGIKHRGSSLADKMYVDIYGNIGKHQNYFRIYGKDTCADCGSKVSYIRLNTRGTYFCPVCQSHNENIKG